MLAADELGNLLCKRRRKFRAQLTLLGYLPDAGQPRSVPKMIVVSTVTHRSV